MTKRGFFRLLSGIIFCTGFFIGLGCDGVLNSRDIIADATDMIEDGKNEAAIELLRPHIYQHHDSFKAHMLAGKAFLNLNSKDEKNLYLARHYFSSASKLATNEGQRLQANRAYADVRMIMGKTGKSADTLLESADRMDTIGESGQATNLYLQAAYRFIQDENYDDAIESCRKGFKTDHDSETNTALVCTMARAYFLNGSYPECLEVLKKLETLEVELTAIRDSEIKFFEAASQMLRMQRKRKLVSLKPWKKEFENDDKQVYIDTFIRSLNVLKRMETYLGVDQMALIGQYSLILAQHAKNNNMSTQAKQAYEYSRAAFRSAGLENKAFGVGEEIRDLES